MTREGQHGSSDGLKPAPAFQVYAGEWLEETADLTLAEQGAVHRLLCHEWRRGPLANDRPRIRLLLGNVPESELKKLWPAIEHFFPLTGSGTRANAKLEDYRREMLARRRERSASGQQGAKSRWKEKRAESGPSTSSANGSAMTQPTAQNDPSSPASASTASSTRTPKSNASLREREGDDDDIPF